MSYYTTIPTFFQCKNMNNREKSPNSIVPGAIRGLFYSFSKLNRYLRAVLQGIHQSVIVVDGNVVDHSVPEFFVKLDGRCFKLGQAGEHTADGNRLGISLLALCREAFELFFLCPTKTEVADFVRLRVQSFKELILLDKLEFDS